MLALLANIALSVVFLHSLRTAQVRARNIMVVGAVNYVVASSTCFGISWISGNLSLSGPTLFWGTVQGVTFIVAYYLICASMALSGMAIASAFIRLSVVIPVLASIFYWDEVPSKYQILGLAACAASMPLIGTRTRSEDGNGRVGWRDFRIIGLLFFTVGLSSVSSKAFVESGVPDARTTFLGVLFGVAAVGALGTFLSRTWRSDFGGVWDGVKVGIVNVVALICSIVALEQLSGVVAFPVQAVGGLLLNTLFAAVVWHERFARRTLIGMAIASLGLALVNVQ
jgi:drug/metabolite transporter (DMT)-like permease